MFSNQEAESRCFIPEGSRRTFAHPSTTQSLVIHIINQGFVDLIRINGNRLGKAGNEVPSGNVHRDFRISAHCAAESNLDLLSSPFAD